MKGYLAVGVITLLTVATLLVPVADSPAFKPAPGSALPAVAVCPVEEGQGRATAIGVISSPNGTGEVTIFAGGGATGSANFDTGEPGSATISVVDVSAVGVAGALADLPDAASAAASVISGSGYLAAESCGATPASQSILAGGSTLSGENMDIQLMNPYAGDATVDLTVWSEAGLESDPSFDSVIVPARSSATLDLRELLPGRETISVVIDVTSGSVIPVGRFSNGSDGAVWRAVPPAQEWLVLAPASQGLSKVIIGTAAPADVSYQIDLYGADGLSEGFAEGVIPGRGAATVDLTSLSTDAVALRIISTGPVAPFLRLEADGGVAMTAGVETAATSWLMPGAGSAIGSATRVVILNSGLEDATTLLTDRPKGTLEREVLVPASSVVVVDLAPGILDGLSLDSDVPVAALWMMQLGPLSAIATGVPIENG